MANSAHLELVHPETSEALHRLLYSHAVVLFLAGRKLVREFSALLFSSIYLRAGQVLNLAFELLDAIGQLSNKVYAPGYRHGCPYQRAKGNFRQLVHVISPIGTDRTKYAANRGAASHG